MKDEKLELAERVQKTAILNILISGKCFFGTKWMLEGNSIVKMTVAVHFQQQPSQNSVGTEQENWKGRHSLSSPYNGNK